MSYFSDLWRRNVQGKHPGKMSENVQRGNVCFPIEIDCEVKEAQFHRHEIYRKPNEQDVVPPSEMISHARRQCAQ